MITPTDYSAGLLRGYGLTCPILPISNGIDLNKYQAKTEKEEAFRQYFKIKDEQKWSFVPDFISNGRALTISLKLPKNAKCSVHLVRLSKPLDHPGWVRRIVKRTILIMYASPAISKGISMKEQ